MCFEAECSDDKFRLTWAEVILVLRNAPLNERELENDLQGSHAPD